MTEQGLTYKISADVTDALSKLNKLQESLNKSSKHINNLGASASKYLDNISGNMQALKEAIERLNLSGTLKQQFDKLFKDLGNNLKTAKTMVTQGNNAFTKASSDTVRDVSSSFNRLGDDLGKLSDKLKKDSKSTSDEVKKDTRDAEATVVNALTNIRSALAMLGITKLTKEILKAASEAERALFALNKIFKSNSDEAQAMAESLSDMYALSEASASRQLADASKILDTYNLSDDVLLDMSSNMVALSQDLSAFTGGAVDASRAMSAVEAALNSDYRALKKTFGIFINDDTIKNLAKRWGLEADNLNTTQKVLLRYQAVMEATKNVSGSFQESQNSLYVTEQELKAAWEDLSVVLGEKLLPVVTVLAKGLTTVLDIMSSFGIGTIVTSAAAVVAVVAAVTKLQLALHKLKLSLDALSTSMGPVGWVLIAVSALLPMIASVIKHAKDATSEAEAQARSTEVLTSNVEAYTKAEEERKKAVDESTKAILALEAAEKREEIINNANILSKKATGIAGNIKSYSSTNNALSKQIAGWDANIANQYANGFSEDDIFNSVAWNNRKGDLLAQEDVVKQLTAAEKELDETLSALANTYVQMASANANSGFTKAMQDLREAIPEGYIDTFNKMVENIQNGLPALAESDELIKSLAQKFNFVEQDWDKMLETSSNKLTASRQALEKASDEYKKIRNDSQKALAEEYKSYMDAISNQIANLEEAKKNSPNAAGIDEEIKRLEAQKDKADQWYDDMWEYYDNVYSKNIQTAAEQLEGKLTALVYKRNQTLKEQENATISDLETKWKEYAKVFNASVGGGTNIESIGNDRASLNAYISKNVGTALKNDDIAALTAAWEAYQKSRTDAEEYYAKQRADKQRELEDALLSVELASTRLTLEQKQEMELTQLERQQAAEQEALEREYKDAENYADMKKALDDKHFRERENMEDAHQEALHSIQVAQETRMRQAELSNVQTTLQQKYDLEKEARDQQRAEEIRTAAATGKDVNDINAYYDKLDENAEDAHQKKLADIKRQQEQAIANADKALLYDRQEIYEAEKKALEEARDYEVAQAELTGKDKELIKKEYDAKLEKLERDHLEKMASIRRQYQRDLTSAQIANNQPLGGYFDLMINAMDRRDASRSQFSAGLTDYIGSVDGINTSKFAAKSSSMDSAFKEMIDNGLSEEEMKKKLREMLDELEYAGDDFELIWGNVWEKVKSNTKSELDQITELLNSHLEAIGDVFNKLDTLFTMAEDNRMQNLQNMMTDLQNQQDKLEKEASDSGRKLTRKEQDELKRRQALYEEQIERQEELIKQQQERQFERQKEFSIAETTIQGIQAAVQSFTKNGGWPWGVAAAALSAAFTGAQIAMIKAQPMPSYAQGAFELPEDQTAQVHKGEMIVPKPFADEIRDNGGFGGITVNVYGTGEDAVVESGVDSDGMQQLNVFVSSKVKGMVANGELDAVLQSRYTLNRNGRRG